MVAFAHLRILSVLLSYRLCYAFRVLLVNRSQHSVNEPLQILGSRRSSLMVVGSAVVIAVKVIRRWLPAACCCILSPLSCLARACHVLISYSPLSVRSWSCLLVSGRSSVLVSVSLRRLGFAQVVFSRHFQSAACVVAAARVFHFTHRSPFVLVRPWRGLRYLAAQAQVGGVRCEVCFLVRGYVGAACKGKRLFLGIAVPTLIYSYCSLEPHSTQTSTRLSFFTSKKSLARGAS